MTRVLMEMANYGHSEVVFCSDNNTGLKAIIAIHDTTLGPALGGLRMKPYETEEAALLDVLRLSRGMTYKSAIAGLNLGGGKSVIIGDPLKDKNEALLRSFGRFVDSLNGKYICAEDMGICVGDMISVSKSTRYVSGLPTSLGGSGDPSGFTALGVLRGIQACAREIFGSDVLRGKRIAIQGLGHVGYILAELVHKEGAEIFCSEMVNTGALIKARNEFGATVIKPEDIYGVNCDIFAPCAIGGILNDKTIPRLKCKIVAGAANNQLAVPDRDGPALVKRGIFYAVDYVVNSGGVINVSVEQEPGGYNSEIARKKVDAIYNIMKQIIELARKENTLPYLVADRLAMERINNSKAVLGGV